MDSIRLPFVDDFLPEFDVESQHTVPVDAPSRLVYEEARRLDLSGSWIVRSLFRLRGLPSSALTADGLARLRFKPLVERPQHGFVLGIIGQFWSPSGRLLDFDPEGFADLEAPGYAKAIWSFDLSTPDAAETGLRAETRLRTVTRVACPDRASRRRFLFYWKLIAPFSGLIRKEALMGVKRAAEARALGRPAGQ